MADLSITAANVTWSGGTEPKWVTFGATVARGKTVVYNSSTKEWDLADANTDLTALKKEQIGIAVTDGADGKKGQIAQDGAQLNIGATTTNGVVYAITSTDVATANGTPGGICAASALGSGDTPIPLFIGNASATVTLDFMAPVGQI